MDKSYLAEMERLFKSTLEFSRQMGPTTFIKEALNPDIPVSKEYSENTNFDFDKYAIAPNGGAIVFAHIKFQTKDEPPYIPFLHVYDSTGQLLRKIELKHHALILNLHITPEECIVVVFKDSTVEVYNLRGHRLTTWTLSEEGHTVNATFCAFWDRGFFLTVAKTIYIFDDLAILKPREFAQVPQTLLTDGVAIAASSLTNCGHMLWSWDGMTIYLFQENDTQSLEFPRPITKIIFSPDNTLALVVCQNNYYFCEANFSKILLSVFFDDIPTIKRYVWVGNDTVLLVSKNKVSMLGAASSVISWDMESTVAAVSEVDGVRMFAKEGIYMIRAIPELAMQFALWNTKFEAVRLFNMMLDDESLALSDPIKEFTYDQFQDALDGCIEAAMFFTNYRLRFFLMKAMSRTQILLPKPKDDGSEESNQLMMLRDFDGFADRLSTLRICSQMFHEPYNMPMTCAQYTDITASVLLKRLCNRSLHAEAFRIAQFTNVSTEFIASHWANCLISSKLDVNEILKKLDGMDQQVDRIDLATTAFELGRTDLAVILLENNKAKARGVPLLLMREKWEEALNAAIDSADTNLIVFAFQEAKKAEQTEIIDSLLEASPMTRDIIARVSEGDERIELLHMAGRDIVDKCKQVLDQKDYEDEPELKAELKRLRDHFHIEMYEFFKKLQAITKWAKETWKKAYIAEGGTVMKSESENDDEYEYEDEPEPEKKEEKPEPTETKEEKPETTEVNEEKAEEKAEANEEKADEKTEAKEEKADEKTEANEEKAEEKTEANEEKAEEKAEAKEEKAEEKPEEKAEEKKEEGRKRKRKVVEKPEKKSLFGKKTAAKGKKGKNVKKQQEEELPPEPPLGPPPNMKDLTPNQLFEIVVLLKDQKKVKEMIKLLNYTPEEAIRYRALIGLKKKSWQVLALLKKETKQNELQPILQEIKAKSASDYEFFINAPNEIKKK